MVNYLSCRENQNLRVKEQSVNYLVLFFGFQLMKSSGYIRLSFWEYLISKKVLAEFWAKKSGLKKRLKYLFWWSFFVGTVFLAVLVYVLREKMKKKVAIYELDSHFKEKYTLGKEPHSWHIF